MAGARQRTNTPPPSLRTPQPRLAEQPRSAEQRPRRQAPERTDGIARRRCTDPCCGLVFILFVAAVAVSIQLSPTEENLQKLTRGIDHRGRVCGLSPGTDGMGLLHWCTARMQHGTILNLSSPICVGHCPGVDETALCPDGAGATEEEQLLEDGGILLVRKQLLSPRQVAVETKPWMDRYCVPTSAFTDVLPSKTSLFGVFSWGAPTEWLVACFERVRQLASTPRLLCLAVAWALLVSLVYLVCLRLFALLIVRLALVGSSLLCCCAAFVLIALPNQDVVPGLLPLVELASGGLLNLNFASLPWSLASEAPVFVSMLGCGLGTAAVLLLLSCFSARQSLEVAADCMRESCAVMMSMPSLLLLPVVDAFVCQVMWIVLLAALPAVLCGADVSGLTVFGVSGVFRHFHLSAADFAHLASLVLACFWIQELVGAACLFATAHSVTLWYFAPGTNLSQKVRHLPAAPALQGLLVACTCHLGSIARGAFAVAILRFLRWILWALYLALRRKDDARARGRRGCCSACVAAIGDSLISALQAWTEFLSSHAYVDIALSSSIYSVAAAKASELLRREARVVSVLSMVACFLRLAGSLFLAAVAALMAQTAVMRHLEWKDMLDELRFRLQVWSMPLVADQLARFYGEVQASSPELLGIITAVATLLVSRALLFNVECAACTILYCLLWDSSDGVLDASNLPNSFWKFAKDRGIESKRS
mmetsp:Transcript_54703/g.127600  ORF Transcript_54703/g.127600 Transcript_54703/m.127600 type:complete len:709 (-) Transcript_54703:114-2240(-)